MSDQLSETKALKVQEQRFLITRQMVPGLAVIGFGVLLLATQMAGIALMSYAWPAFVLVPGLLLMMPAYNSTPEKISRASFFAVPGALLLTVGGLLFSMNLANGYFEAMAYSWPLMVIGVLAGLMYMHRFNESHPIHTNGRKAMRVLFYLFTGFALFFELLIFESFSPILPVFLIGLGVLLLVRQRRQTKFA